MYIYIYIYKNIYICINIYIHTYMFDSVECSSHIHERDLQIGYCGIGTKRQATKRRETKRHDR